MSKPKKILIEAKAKKPKGVQLSAYVDADLRARVEQIASDSGTTVSYTVKALIIAGLEHYEG